MRNVRKKSIPWTTITACLLITFVFGSAAAFALEPNQAVYIGGSVAIPGDTPGRMDTSSPMTLLFHYKKPDGTAGQIGVDYAAIKTAYPGDEVTHHLGVAPAIAVGLIAARRRRYFVTLTWTDEKGISQAAQIEISKHDQQPLLAVIRARMPRPCQRTPSPCAHLPSLTH
jgi:hypothetical protein